MKKNMKNAPAVPEISAALAEVIGSTPIPRSEVTKNWEYIKANNLQDASNRSIIYADAKLKAVFDGKDHVNIFEMHELVSAHLSPETGRFRQEVRIGPGFFRQLKRWQTET